MNPKDELVKVGGQWGVWTQGDCVFIPCDEPILAVNLYRRKLAQGSVAVCTHRPDGLRVRGLVAENACLREALRAAALPLAVLAGGVDGPEPGPHLQQDIREAWAACQTALLREGR